jgi:hypothetical protein
MPPSTPSATYDPGGARDEDDRRPDEQDHQPEESSLEPRRPYARARPRSRIARPQTQRLRREPSFSSTAPVILGQRPTKELVPLRLASTHHSGVSLPPTRDPTGSTGQTAEPKPNDDTEHHSRSDDGTSRKLGRCRCPCPTKCSGRELPGSSLKCGLGRPQGLLAEASWCCAMSATT